jgi:excisionase family DNA binding protein
MLSARAAAAYCGVSDKTIRNWIASGRITAEQAGRSYQIDEAQLQPHRRAASQARRLAVVSPPMPVIQQARHLAVQTWARRVVALLDAPWDDSPWWAEALGRYEGELMLALARSNDVEQEYLAAVALAAKRRDGQSLDTIAARAHADYEAQRRR